MDRHQTARLGWGIRAAAVLTLLVAACGGAASPTPTPTPTPIPTAAPTPTPTPVDVAAAFAELISDPDLSAKVSAEITAKASGITIEIGLAMRLAGDKAAGTVTVGDIAAEVVVVGDSIWGKSGGGPWLEQDPTSSPARLEFDTWFQDASNLEDLGEATIAGQRVHHLRPTGGIVPDEILPLEPAIRDAGDWDLGLDFYVLEDGTPVRFELFATCRCTMSGTTTDVEVSAVYEFEDVGKPQTILRPTDVWTVFENEALGYSMAHPAGWTVESNADGDDYVVDGVATVFVYPQAVAAGTTLDEFTADVAGTHEGELGVAPSTTVDAAVGGLPAKLLLFQWSLDGTPLAAFDVIAVRGGVGWEIQLLTLDGPELEPAGELFDVFLASFTFLE